MASEAQTAIHELHARGWTDTAIGRQVGRDSSLIHQISTGHKPGTTLATPLQALAASGLPGPASAKALPNIALPAAGVRQAARGGAARVRVGKGGLRERAMQRLLQRPGVSLLKNGQIHSEGATKDLALDVAGAAETLPGAKIRITYQVNMSEKGKKVEYEWRTLNTGGITPAALREAIHQAARGRGTWREALQYLIDLYYRSVGTPTGKTAFFIVAEGAA